MSILPETIGSLFEMSRDPVLGIDGSRTVVFANPAAAAQLGAHPGDSAAALLPEHILNDPAERFIATYSLGSRRANVSIQQLEGITICTWSLLDSTPPPPSQDRALQELASRLMSARLAIDALVRKTKAEDDEALLPTTEALYQTYYQVLRACQHMQMTSAILRNDLPMVPAVTDLGALCREMCDTLGRLFEDTGVSVLFQGDFGMHLTMADNKLLEHMLANLLANSLFHCRRGDTIRVELSRQEDRFVISVRDTGEGIAPELMAQIFNGTADPNSLTAGAGQGLLIARGIAERHGGAIIMESRPGQGTNVRVILPYRRSDSLQMSSPRVQYHSDGMNTVLTEFSILLDKKYYTRRMFD